MIYCKGVRKKYQWEKEELDFADAFEGKRTTEKGSEYILTLYFR